MRSPSSRHDTRRVCPGEEIVGGDADVRESPICNHKRFRPSNMWVRSSAWTQEALRELVPLDHPSGGPAGGLLVIGRVKKRSSGEKLSTWVLEARGDSKVLSRFRVTAFKNLYRASLGDCDEPVARRPCGLVVSTSMSCDCNSLDPTSLVALAQPSPRDGHIVRIARAQSMFGEIRGVAEI